MSNNIYDLQMAQISTDKVSNWEEIDVTLGSIENSFQVLFWRIGQHQYVVRSNSAVLSHCLSMQFFKSNNIDDMQYLFLKSNIVNLQRVFCFYFLCIVWLGCDTAFSTVFSYTDLSSTDVK